MCDSPSTLTITRITTPGRGDIVRIEAKDKLRLLARMDMSLPDYAAATLGEPVTAAFTQGRGT